MGTSFSNPIGRGNRARYHESSRLRSPRDTDAVPKVWQKCVKVEDQLFRVAQACEQLQRQFNRLRMRKGDIVSSGPHPFKIEQGSTWLKFFVSTGYAIASDHALVPTHAGPDGSGNRHEFTLTSGVPKFYFCLVFTSPTGAIITTSSTLPAWGIDVIPIGWVDTDTDSADSESIIYQFLNDHVFSPCVV